MSEVWHILSCPTQDTFILVVDKLAEDVILLKVSGILSETNPEATATAAADRSDPDNLVKESCDYEDRL